MAKRKRKAIPGSLRFEVFKRDSFTCQYCGRAAPDVILELDHIEPHSKGGGDDILNLLTSCEECNAGKSDRRLDDNSVLAKQRDQLKELNARREQLEMMIRWREGVQNVETDALAEFAKAYNRHTQGWVLNEKGLRDAKAVIRKHGLARALAATDRAAEQCLLFKDGKATAESVSHMFNLWRVLSQPDDVQRLYKIRARVRGRWNYVDDARAIRVLRRLYDAGVGVDEIDAQCSEWMRESGTSFRWWLDGMEQWVVDVLRDKETP